MPRIKPTDVTAAFRAAVAAGKLAGVDTQDWGLRMQGSNFMVCTGSDPNNPVPGLGIYFGGYFAASYREAHDFLRGMQRAWEMVPHTGQMGTYPCWHVEASNGLLYGVAAMNKTGAFAMLDARLAAEGEKAFAVKGEKVATWETAYATVLCYGEA